MAKKDRIYVSRENDRLVMRFPSELEHINQAETETRRFLERAGLPDDIFPVCLVMREAMLNAVKHGNRYDPRKKVSYSLQLQDDILTMEIEDEGEGFEWQSHTPDRPAAESEHGRGLFIMRRYFSDFTFNQRGNKITLTKYCASRRPDMADRRSRLEKLAQAILLDPATLQDTDTDELYRLIEDQQVRLNHLALENAELHRAQNWLQANQPPRPTASEDDRYRALFEYNPIETITVDHGGRVTEYNLAKEKAGDRLPEIGSVMYRDYAASHTIDMHRQLQECIRTGQPREFPELPYRSKYLHIRIAPFSGGAIITSVNITPLKEAEKDLARLATAIEQAREEIVVIDREGRVEYANAAFLNNNNYSRADVPGLEFFSKDRQPCDKACYEDIWNALHQGRVWTGRFRRTAADSEPDREIEETISPVKDDKGKIICYVSVSRDITREVQLEEQLRHAQKMKAIGTLAGGIAHDFNNILGAITANAELIQADTPAESEPAASAGEILQASRRARDLINQVLLFSRHSTSDRQPLRVAVIVKETLKMLRAMLPATIQISQRIKEDSAIIMADPTQIQEVLMNLCNNSAQAMAENGGHLKISLEKAAPEEAAACPALAEGDHLKLSVYDTGRGISPNIIDRIFDPFFTDGEPGRSSGLGLSVTHGIVSNHGGAITVASDPGRWTEFKVFFPLTKTAQTGLPQTAETLPGGGESILLVDDEALMIRVGEKMLTRLGYRVTTAGSGTEALELFMADPAGYDLVITDMTMPYMTGVDLARTLMDIRPDIPIILCTGFNAMITPEKARQLGIRKFLMKPFETGKLAAAIQAVLGRRNVPEETESDWS